MTDEYPESKQKRREKRRAAREAKMAKHGKGLAAVYRDAVLKRLGSARPIKKLNPERTYCQTFILLYTAC